ncbi:hypothetical protein [Acidovorax temperans]|uniref:hypothetical protein n=1 Tax=Acidovorax temperans TaxID=80878 RepID=UPI0030CCD7B0
MPATQISFLAFAQAAQQQASVCTPPVTQAATVLVAQPVVADGGECIDASAAYESVCELLAMHGRMSNGAWVLLCLAQAQGGITGRLDNSTRCASYDALVSQANYCIQAGC